MNLIQFLLDNLLTLAPWFLVTQPEVGVIFRFGKNPRVVQPGFHWRIPFVDHIEEVSSVVHSMLLPIQTVETKDNQAICFSLRIGFVVDDPIAHITQITDYDEGVEAIVQIEAGQRVREFNYSELKDIEKNVEVKDLLKFLTRTLTAEVRKWGVKITVVGFNDWAHVRSPIRLFGVRSE